MKRITERGIMDNEEQVQAYAEADFSDSNQLFLEILQREFSRYLHIVLDLGCGPADLGISLAKADHLIHLIGIDGSEAMVKIARKKVEQAELTTRIEIIQGFIPDLKITENIKLIISKDTLHHFKDPTIFWRYIKDIASKGTAICVMDLKRPESVLNAKEIVEQISAHEHPTLKRDFYNSLLAAFTPQEIKEQLRKVGLNLSVTSLGKRHFVVKGII
ncbi:MAG TPA: class I SAM-dependent methyltransferase [Candidatus Nanoarchaeia archaeon]|nr:class I SAM-dependent methyltransferase [Candidatus Nanoarchaeia archaeon]